MKTVTLGEVCTITMGQAPSGESYNDSGAGMPLVAGPGDFDVSIPNIKKFTTAPTKVSQSGDIILGVRASIGDRVWADREYCLGRGVAGLRPSARLDCHYLWHWLSHSAPILASKGRGATFLQVNRRDIAEMEIPLPTIAEQRRIAAILDHADALRKKRARARELLGKLAASTFVAMFGDPLRNERRWGTSSLGDLGEWHSGATPPRAKLEYFGGDIPWYSSGELGPLFSTTTNEHVSKLALEHTSLKKVPVGALMMGMYDTAAFKSSIASMDCSCNQAIAFSKLNHRRIETIFAYFAIQLASSRLRNLQRGIRQKNLNLSIVRQIEIPVPPIELQNSFRRNTLTALQVRDHVDGASVNLDELFASLQARAFRGEL